MWTLDNLKEKSKATLVVLPRRKLVLKYIISSIGYEDLTNYVCLDGKMGKGFPLSWENLISCGRARVSVY